MVAMVLHGRSAMVNNMKFTHGSGPLKHSTVWLIYEYNLYSIKSLIELTWLKSHSGSFVQSRKPIPRADPEGVVGGGGLVWFIGV